MTSKEASALHTELTEVLEKFGKEHNLTFKPFRLTYGDDGIRFKAEGAWASDADGNEIDVRKKDFENLCRFYGFEESDYMKMFKGLDGKNYQLIGFNTRARKNCLLLKAVNGQEYMAPSDFIGASA